MLAITPALFRPVALFRVGIPQFTVAESSGMWDLVVALLVGMLQDVCVAGLLLVPALLAARRSRLAGALTLSAVFVATHLYYLLDLLLYQSRRIRMSATFLEFLAFPQPFLDSAWAAGLALLIGGAAVVLGIGGLVAWGGFRLLPAPGGASGAGASPWVGVPRKTAVGFAAFVLLTVASTEALHRTTHYASSNIVFRDVFRTLYDRESRWSDPESLSEELVIERYLTASGELFERLDPQYPLLKNTTGFTGPTHFGVERPDERPPHVVLLFMESLRAADVGAMGALHRPSVTPSFDALAEEGVLYTQFYGNGVQTTRAVIAGLFGIPPRFTRRAVQSDDVDYPLLGIQDVFRGAGYRTAYYHNGPLDFELKTEFFGAHGFQDIEGDLDIAARHPEAERTSWGVHDEWLMEDVVAWLTAQEERGEPGFLTAFTVTNHHPWEVPNGYEAPRLAAPPAGEYGDYLGTLAYSDQALGHLIELLSGAGLSERVVLVVLGDTSQPLGEHDENYMPVRHLYEESLRVPFLLWAPGRIPGPLRIADIGSQVDVLPTVMDIAGVGGINHGVGTSLRRVVPSRSAYVANPFHLRLRGMREGRYKYIASEAAEREALYDLTTDPGELLDLSDSESEVTTGFRAHVRAMARVLDRLWDEQRFVPPQRD